MKKSKTKTVHVPRAQGLTKKMRVEFVIPETPPTAVYANQMVVQSDGRAAYLSFFVAQPPLLIGEKGDIEKQIEEMDSIKAHMVAQVIVPQDRMGDFMRVLNNVFVAGAEMQGVVDSGSQGLIVKK